MCRKTGWAPGILGLLFTLERVQKWREFRLVELNTGHLAAPTRSRPITEPNYIVTPSKASRCRGCLSNRMRFLVPGICPEKQIFSGMARLTHSDLEAVLRVAQEVSRARTRDEFSRVAVTELAELVRSDVLALNEVDPSAGRIS